MEMTDLDARRRVPFLLFYFPFIIDESTRTRDIRRFSSRVIGSAKQLCFECSRISRRRQQQVADFYPPSSHASARGTMAQFPRQSINSRERPKDRFTTKTRGESSSSEKKPLLRFLPRF